MAAAGSPLPPSLPSPSWGWSLHTPQGLCAPTPSRLDWLSLPGREAKSCLRTSLHDVAPMVHAPASAGPLWSPSVAGGSWRHSADDPVSIPKPLTAQPPGLRAGGSHVSARAGLPGAEQQGPGLGFLVRALLLAWAADFHMWAGSGRPSSADFGLTSLLVNKHFPRAP